MWYSAKLLIISAVDDGKKTVPALVEESIILIEAESPDTAKERALEAGLRMEHEYDNYRGRQVRWRFGKLLELQDLSEEKVFSGMEVFSTIYRRKGGSAKRKP